MSHSKVGVVILNYKAYWETIECVESFKKQTYSNLELIVVENGSGNESKEKLSSAYSDDAHVHVIVSDVNLGFAKGNNLGITYARNSLGCEDVIVINSDTIVQPTWVEEMVSRKEQGVAVISPTVVHTDGLLQMPSENADSMPKEIMRVIKNIYLTKLLNLRIIKALRNKKADYDMSTGVGELPAPKKYYLEGCAYMLTSEFFKHYSKQYPETFLYWEELNLLWYVYKAGLKTLYADTSPVLHKVAVSTKVSAAQDEYEKIRTKRVMEGMRASLPLYLMSYQSIIRKYES